MQSNPRLDALIATHGNADADAVFAAVESYADLQYVNIAFLQGKVNYTPYHLAPIDAETVPLLDYLVRINAHGFISIEGQPATYYSKFIAETWEDDDGTECGNWWYEEAQKPYIRGFMPVEDIERFVDHMARYKNSYFYMLADCRGMIVANTFPKLVYNVTRTKAHPDKTMIARAQRKLCTNIHTRLCRYAHEDFIDFPNVHDMLIAQAYSLTIAGAKYAEGSVEQVLLDFYEGR